VISCIFAFRDVPGLAWQANLKAKQGVPSWHVPQTAACQKTQRVVFFSFPHRWIKPARQSNVCSAVYDLYLNPLEGGLKYVAVIKAFVDDPSELPTSNIIPWTIKNKYYSADVHFHLVEFSHWNPQSALRVPAVIFVWTRGQVASSSVSPLMSDRC
jgi:hypothetical protein